MNGITTTDSIKQKNGRQTSKPFIKLKSFKFNTEHKRIDCHILICEDLSIHEEQETKIKNLDSKLIEIKQAAKGKDKKSLIKELGEMQKPLNCYTSQYPSFDSTKALTETKVYDLIKAQYTGVKNID